jgi:oligopeptide transport system ATP-binding protein
VRGLKKYFPIRSGFFSRVTASLKAVDGVSFWINRGETLGLVGESGSGKSTTGRALLRLIEPTEGAVRFDGEDVHGHGRRRAAEAASQAQIIFQDPYASLNPRMTVGDTLREVLKVHNLARGEAADRRVRELLDRVGLSAVPRQPLPHEFSGGQRQRIGIARALSVEPDFIVCDEPVSALDVSVQAQVVNLLEELQEDLGLAYLFIAHDLSVVEHVSDRVAVMYLGRIVEIGRRRRHGRRPASTPTPGRCCRPSPCRSPAGNGSGSSCRATCRAPSTRRPGARSTPAAPTP